MNKSNFGFAGVLFAFYLDRENARFQKLHFRPGEKFILFDSFLGVGENLLLEFWSPFSLVFLFFSAREIC